MTTTLRKTLALLLCLCMCLSLVPAAFAEEPAFGEEEVFSFEEPAFGEEPVEEEPVEEEPAFSEEPFTEEPVEEPAFSEEPAEELSVEEEPVEEGPAVETAAGEPEEEPAEEPEPTGAPVFEAEEGEEFDASSGTWGILIWTLDQNGRLDISGNGRMDDFSDVEDHAAWRAHRDQIQRVVIGGGVTSVGKFAFTECGNLTEIELPAGLQGIGPFAFAGCFSLTAVTLPEDVTVIGNDAFNGCGSLTDISIPQGVERIRESTFMGCSSMRSISLPQSVTEISRSAFDGCSSLRSISLPQSVTEIGESAFYGCSALTDIRIPQDVTHIREAVFYGCSGLTCVTLPQGVTEIGESAFNSCIALEEITIPVAATYIGCYAFTACRRLSRVYYFGTQAQWNRIRIEGDNGPLLDAEIFFGYQGIPALKSVANVNSGVQLVWLAVAGTPKYRVYRKTGTANWAALANVAGTSFTDTKVTAGTSYTYTVRCLNAAGSPVGSYDTVGKTIRAAGAGPVLISAAASGGGIVFKWNAVAGAAGYRVYRKTGTANWTALANVTATTYTDTRVTAGTTYIYTARCLNAAGNPVGGYDTAGKSATAQYAAPVLISAAASGNSIVFKWNAVNGSPKYRVYRKTAGGSWTALANVTSTSYTDTNVTKGMVYTYTVRCVTADGKTCVSGFNADGKSAFVSLPTPSLVSAAASGSSIVFKWNAVNGAAKYRVYRKTAGGSWTALANVSGTSYTDTNVTKGTVYTYTVRCVTADGKTCVSGFNATGKSAFVSLPTPTLVSAAASGSSIVFKWNAVSGAAKYRVYRKTAGGSWTALANVAGTSYTDTNVTRGTTYTYTVRCVTADGKTCVSGFNATGKSARVG